MFSVENADHFPLPNMILVKWVCIIDAMIPKLMDGEKSVWALEKTQKKKSLGRGGTESPEIFPYAVYECYHMFWKGSGYKLGIAW